MNKITQEEIREIAGNIVSKTNESTNDFDAIDDISDMLRNMLINMKAEVEEIKRSCKCTDCKCNK